MTRPSTATKLPLEIVEIIIDYLQYDRRSLRACTLTCYSWYIAAVPCLHDTLIVYMGDPNFRWREPISRMHTLGLLPLVKTFWICRGREYSRVELSKKPFNYRFSHQFSALTNVQELEIEHLDIPSFMPGIQRYFCHFLPTVKSLSLTEPRGSRRQIIYFIGLFQHLQDLSVTNDRVIFEEESVDDLSLFPSFIPPLDGWLKINDFTRVEFLEDMIDLFGGMKFRYMVLFNVVEMRLLLDACAKTLQSVMLYPSDPRGEQLPLYLRKLWPMIPQLNPPFKTLIYRGTSRFGVSKSRYHLLIAR